MQAVILAGGLGKRLRPFTQVIPKPLLPIGAKSLLEIQIERLRSHGFDEIYIATNYKSDYIINFLGDGKRYGVKLHMSPEEKPLGTAGPLSLIREHLREPFLLVNGDILSTINFSKFHQFAQDHEADLCVTIKKIHTPFGFGRIESEGDFVVRIEEKPTFVTQVLAGIYSFKPPLLDLIPDDEYYGIDTLIQTMLEQSRPVAKWEIKEYWLDIGQVPDYEKAQKDYQLYFDDNAEPEQ